MNIDDISPELKEKAKACKSEEELVSLATSEGIELTREEWDAISGGIDWSCIWYCENDSSVKGGGDY